VAAQRLRDFQSRMVIDTNRDVEWFEKGAFVLPELVGADYPHLAREVAVAKDVEVVEANVD
jgi:hypothetical protein